MSCHRADTPRSKSPAAFSHHIWSVPVFFSREIYPPRIKEILRRRSPSTPALYYRRIIRRPFIYCIVFVLNWGNSSSRACGVFRAWLSFLKLNFSVVWRMDSLERELTKYSVVCANYCVGLSVEAGDDYYLPVRFLRSTGQSIQSTEIDRKNWRRALYVAWKKK